MNINRWSSNRGQITRTEPRPDDPINRLAAIMGEYYGVWYQTLPLAIAGDMSKFRALVDEKLDEIRLNECIDNGVNICACSVCQPCRPSQVDEVLPF